MLTVWYSKMLVVGERGDMGGRKIVKGGLWTN